MADFIPDSDFKPDESPAPASTQAGPDFIPDSKFESDEDKYGTLPQQALTALEGAGSALTLGTSTGLETLAGVKKEDIEARRQENPLSHAAGQVGALVGSSLLMPGAGAAGLMDAAGTGAVKALGLGAAEKTAAELGVAAVERSLGAKIGSAAVKGAVENMIFQSGDEVSKMLSSDHPATVGTIASNVGLSGLIGGGISGLLGSVSPLWNATFGKETAAALNDTANEAEHVIENGVPSPTAEYAPELEKELSEGFQVKRENANEIAGAADRLGLDPGPAAVSDDQMMHAFQSDLNKSGTHWGIKVRDAAQKFWTGLEKHTESIFRDATTLSEHEVGKTVKQGIIESLDKELKPIEAKYEELKPHFQNIEVAPDLKIEATKNILNHELAQFKGPARAAAEDITETLSDIKNLNQLKSYRTLLNGQVRQAERAGAQELPVLYAAKREINALRESSIEAASKATGIGEKEAEAVSSKTIQDIKEADTAYRAYKEKLTAFGREAGIGKVGSARSLLDKFKGLSDEALATKVFDMNDLNQLNFFKENFPKEFELARRYKLKELLQKSIPESLGNNGQINIGKVLRLTGDDAMNPEAREILFAGNKEKIQDIRTLFGSATKNLNPPNTGAAIARRSMFTPEGAIDHVTDGIKYALLHNTPKLMKAAGTTDAKATGLAAMMFLKAGRVMEGGPFKAAVDVISNVIKADNAITKGAAEVFKAGREVIPSKIFEKKDAEKLDKQLKGLQSNNQALFNSGGDTGALMPDTGMHISQTAMSAVNYLNSLRPDETKKLPLDASPVLTEAQKKTYFNALSMAQNPLQILNKIKHGSVMPEDLTHLQSLYPGLYKVLAQKLTAKMTDHLSDGWHIPYATKMGMSLFLAQPLDSTMAPGSIMSIQNMFGSASQSKDQQQQGMPSTRGKHGSMKDINKLSIQAQTPEQAHESRIVAKG